MVSLQITKPRVLESLRCTEPLSCIFINKASNKVFSGFRNIIPCRLIEHKTAL